MTAAHREHEIGRIAVSACPESVVVGRVPFIAPDGSYTLRLRSVPGLDVVELPHAVGMALFRAAEQGVPV